MDDDREPQPFTGWLLEQRNGALHAELGAGLAELVEAVEATGKAGELRLTVKIAPATKGQGGVVGVSDDVSLKLPALARPTAIWFVDGELRLTRNDPRQLELPLREVPRADPKEVSGG